MWDSQNYFFLIEVVGDGLTVGVVEVLGVGVGVTKTVTVGLGVGLNGTLGATAGAAKTTETTPRSLRF